MQSEGTFGCLLLKKVKGKKKKHIFPPPDRVKRETTVEEEKNTLKVTQTKTELFS